MQDECLESFRHVQLLIKANAPLQGRFSLMNTIILKRHASPLGTLLIGSFGDQLCLCDFEQGWHQSENEKRLKRLLKAEFAEGTSPVIEQTIEQLSEYFKGERKTFDLPLMPVGTDFQLKVWRALQDIPYGETISYAEEAARIGHPKSFRAVANANGRNPIAIIIPCHRVIGSNGTLTGYGGGMEAKRTLLEQERSLN